MPDLPDWSQSVSIDATSVTIPVSGTVSITSGTVTIANASIAVINASGTKITSARPPVVAGSVVDSPNPNTLTTTIPADVQAVAIVLRQPLANYVHIKVAFTPQSGNAVSWVPLELFQFTQQVYVVPVLPSAVTSAGGFTATSLDITLQGTALNSQALDAWWIFEGSPLWLEVFPLPQLEPNQPPFFIDPGPAVKNGVGAVGLALIAAVANVQIFLFEMTVQYVIYGAAHVAPSFTIGHSATIPTFAGGGPTQAQTLLRRNGLDSSIYTYVFHGAPLPRGDGIWVYNTDTGDTVDVGVEFNYSLG